MVIGSRRSWLGALALVAVACTSGATEEDGADDGTSSSGATSDTDTTSTDGSSSDATSVDGTETGTTSVPVDSSDEDAETSACEPVTVTAVNRPAPVDVLIALDTSPSMADETAFVQDQLNAFWMELTAAGLDPHVILIAWASPNGPCIPEPLGGGMCPDDMNLPDYRHVFVQVGSGEALSRIVEGRATYAPSIRWGSRKHVVVVTDSDSAMAAADFDTAFVALGPDYAQYVLHALVGQQAPDAGACAGDPTCCDGVVPLASAVGQVYLDLAMMTGGVTGDLCDQDFPPTFEAIAEQLATTTPQACDWPLPELPAGVVFDADHVEVLLELDARTETLPRLATGDACRDEGWSFDEDEESVRLCPQTCERVRAAADLQLDVVFGCG